MSNPIIALITGAIRDPFEFFPIVAKLAQYRSENLIDQILFTTWNTQYLEHKDIFHKLEKLGVALLFVSDIDHGGPSNMWRQYRLFEHSLRVCPENSFVLKARTDKTIQILEKFKPVLELTRQGNFPKTNEGPTKVFNYKLAVPYVGLNFLFFVKDIVFFGERDDLRQLTHFEIWFDLFAAIPGIEWQWKAAPFFRKFPIFRDFSEIYRMSGLARGLWEKPNEVPDILVQILALYYHCLYSNFTMHMSPEDHSLDFSLEEMLSGRAAVCGYPPGPNCTWAMSASTKQLQYVMEGKLPPSKIHSRLIDALNSKNTFMQDLLTRSDHKKIEEFFSDLDGNTGKSPPFFAQNISNTRIQYWETLSFLGFEELFGFKLNENEKSIIDKFSNNALNYSYLVPEMMESAISNGDQERALKWQEFGMKDPTMRMKGY